jgi:hypothetical protein
MKSTLTLIVPCSDIPSQVAGFLEHLAATQPAERIDLVLVVWEGCDYASRIRAPYASVRQVSFPRTGDLEFALAEAVNLSATDAVLIMEDHVRPVGPWVEETLQRIGEGYSALSWIVTPGQRESSTSWAGYLAEYGSWGRGVPAGEVHGHLPGHNCAYRRAALIALGDDLHYFLRAESLLHWRLLREGQRLCLSNSCEIVHYQYPRTRHFVGSNFWYGWAFGDARRRTERWHPLRAAAYALAVPLLKPWLRWRALLAAPWDRAAAPRGILARCAPEVFLGYFASAAGEALGALVGEGPSPRKCSEWKLGVERGGL